MAVRLYLCPMSPMDRNGRAGRRSRIAMSKLTPRPGWPEGREPLNGGLLLIQLAAILVLAAIVLGGCWSLWWLATLVETL